MKSADAWSTKPPNALYQHPNIRLRKLGHYAAPLLLWRFEAAGVAVLEAENYALHKRFARLCRPSHHRHDGRAIDPSRARKRAGDSH